jgi:hypothetical protein
MKKIETKFDGEFKIVSNRMLRSPHWPVPGGNEIVVHDRSLAVAMAAKTKTVPCGGEIRVVHTPSGEVIFRKLNECDCGMQIRALDGSPR